MLCLLNLELSKIDWNIGVDDVQQFWNIFKSRQIKIVDTLVPLVDHHNNVIKEKFPWNIKNKINKRNRLLKSFKRNPIIERKKIITDLNCEIKSHFFSSKKYFVRKGIVPGNSKTLWHAVKIAKNKGPAYIPQNLLLNECPVASHEITESFALFFENKVSQIVSSTRVNPNVHNGKRKIYK